MRTKIVATLGPASMDQQVMKEMVELGVRIFRLNFSHADAAYFGPVIQKIREVEKETGIRLTVMGDLCGPKIRIGEVKGSPLQIRKGAYVCLGTPEMESRKESDIFISLDVPELLEGLAEDMPVSLSDGMLQFKVVKVVQPDRLVTLEALNGGILTSNKGIAFPGKTLKVAAMTDKDRRDLHQGIDIGIDAVALSFVQSKDDIEDIKTEIARHGTWIPVVAKVERKNAVEKLDSILDVADAIMVARGDLGLECSPAELPIIQKKILRSCRHAQKPAIVATQMLLSMVKNPIPTRAESTDVANAMLDGTDCVMLSEETAIGSYPVEAVRFINEIAQYAETYYLERIGGPLHAQGRKEPPEIHRLLGLPHGRQRRQRGHRLPLDHRCYSPLHQLAPAGTAHLRHDHRRAHPALDELFLEHQPRGKPPGTAQPPETRREVRAGIQRLQARRKRHHRQRPGHSGYGDRYDQRD